MISTKTAQVTKYCGLFIILLLFLSGDLAFTLTLSLYIAVNSNNYTKLLAISIFLFIADLLLKQLDISIRFISDLSLDSYILLLTCLFIYIKSQKDILVFFQKLEGSGRKLISRHTLEIIVISLILALLLSPIVGIPFAAISGYISFSYFSKHFEGKYAYIAGLFFLFFCPFFIIAKRDDISENLAVISFYFLIIGTIQEVISIMQVRKEAKSFAFSLPKINFRLPQYIRQLMKFIIIAGITALVSFLVTFFLLS